MVPRLQNGKSSINENSKRKVKQYNNLDRENGVKSVHKCLFKQ